MIPHTIIISTNVKHVKKHLFQSFSNIQNEAASSTETQWLTDYYGNCLFTAKHTGNSKCKHSEAYFTELKNGEKITPSTKTLGANSLIQETQMHLYWEIARSM